jgi:ABC-type Fe3+-siderophore transport system permease subunit
MRRYPFIFFIAVSFLGIFFAALSLSLGSVSIPFYELWNVIFNHGGIVKEKIEKINSDNDRYL